MFPSRARGLYREEAIQHLNAGESLQQALSLVPIAKWWWMLCVLLMLISMLIWSTCAYIPVIVEGRGVIISGQGVDKAETLLLDLSQKNQDTLKQLKDLYEKKDALYKRRYITLDDLLKTEKEYLLANQDKDNFINLGSKIKDDINQKYEALIFVDPLHSADIKPGNQVKVKLNTHFSQSSKEIRGQVAYLSDYPVSKKMVNAYLNNSNLVDDLFSIGSPILIKVYLDSKNSAYPFIKAGEAVNANIIVKVITPLEIIKSK